MAGKYLLLRTTVEDVRTYFEKKEVESHAASLWYSGYMQNNDKPLSEYQLFVKDKHERLFNAPEEIINAAIEKATGSKIISKERIIKGEANEVHSVNTEDGQRVIIRISHGDEPAFEREQWAIERSVEAGVLAPYVLLVDQAYDGEKSLALSVETQLRGIPMNELDDLLNPENKDLLDDLLRQAGQVLSAINSVKVAGFGELDKEGKGIYATVQEALLNEYVAGSELFEILDKVGLDPAVSTKALDILKKGASTYPPIQPRLTHNDFGPKHLLIDNNKISGVIDFENADGGDPVKEFARWKFYFDDKYPLDTLMQGYSDKGIFSEDFEQRLQLWMIHWSLAGLHYYYKEKNTIGIKLAKRKLLECVD